MNQIVNEKGELVLNRTAYMQHLLISTYPHVAIKAILTGTLKGAQESAIADQLFLDCYADQNKQAFDILELTGDENYTRETFVKAGYLVTGSVLSNKDKV